ncbi:MAG: hypothetical protein EZS28_011047, partial [Streblomastix strix]
IYSPSEAHKDERMTFMSDIWSTGVIVIEALTGKHPFEGKTQEETINNIKNGRFAPFPEYITGDLKIMLLRMIDANPTKRPTAAELLSTDLMFCKADINLYKTAM